MAVLVIAEVPGQTEEKYDGMIAVLRPALQEARGFIAHGAGPSGDGESWRSFEVWESQADATAFFVAHIHPNLPAGIKPKRTLIELHNLVISPDAGSRG